MSGLLAVYVAGRVCCRTIDNGALRTRLASRRKRVRGGAHSDPHGSRYLASHPVVGNLGPTSQANRPCDEKRTNRTEAMTNDRA